MSSAGQSLEHDAGHDEIDEGLARHAQVLVVFREAPALAQPTEGAFKDPAILPRSNRMSAGGRAMVALGALEPAAADAVGDRALEATAVGENLVATAAQGRLGADAPTLRAHAHLYQVVAYVASNRVRSELAI